MKQMNNFININHETKQRQERILNEILNHDKVKTLLRENSSITMDMIKNDLHILKQYTEYTTTCNQCTCVDKCLNVPKGFIPKMDIRNGRLNMIFHKCEKKIREDEYKALDQQLQSFHIPLDIKEAEFNKLYVTDNNARRSIIEESVRRAKTIKEGLPTKGLYLYGSFGVGKSYLLGAIANYLKSQHIQTVMVFVPEFIGDLKSGFKDGTTNEKIAMIKNANVLILDDLGAEDVTPWVRDEVIMSILHYRMVSNKPTFISSNFTVKELETHYSRSKDDYERTKARRIVERIEFLTDEYHLTGENFRKM